jgi:hypothetical protein
MTHSPNASNINREPEPVLKGKKKGKPKIKQWHVANTKFGMGDNYGTGIRQNLGKMRSSYTPPVNTTAPKSLKKPPKNLA